VTLAVLTGFVGLLGVGALAGFGVAVRLEYVIYPLSFGFSAGMLAMVATNIGAGRLARAQRSAWTAAALVAGIIGAIGLFALVWPTGWAALFSAVPEVQHDAAVYLTIAGLAFPCLSIGLVLGTAFQAAGRPLWPLLAPPHALSWSSAVERWLSTGQAMASSGSPSPRPPGKSPTAPFW
jgi:Na+-driven multidrug efflux pump